MIRHVYRHRVRYRECDPMGIVYHTHYLDYFEAARTEALRELGLAYRELESAGVIMPVVEAQLRYRRPAHYDDVLEIETTISEPPGIRINIAYEVRRERSPEVLVTGNVTLCFVDAARNRPISAPPQVAEIFAPYFEAPM